jgi:hypothetical protein
MDPFFGQPLANGRVAVYVPSTRDVSQPLTEAEHQAEVDTALREFGQWFGGATSTRAVGSWLAADGSLVKETVTIVYSFADLTPAQQAGVREFALDLARRLGQEGVLVEWNGKAYLVAPF